MLALLYIVLLCLSEHTGITQIYVFRTQGTTQQSDDGDVIET